MNVDCIFSNVYCERRAFCTDCPLCEPELGLALTYEKKYILKCKPYEKNYILKCKHIDACNRLYNEIVKEQDDEN